MQRDHHGTALTVDPARGPHCDGCPRRVSPCHTDPRVTCDQIKAHHAGTAPEGHASADRGVIPWPNCCGSADLSSLAGIGLGQPDPIS